ncbi:MAG TPA: aspartyl protease family protein [Steroidobacteraceae bacterium]|nr:aspartyl protease family protein [Steroidobacteraceae bacterium]
MFQYTKYKSMHNTFSRCVFSINLLLPALFAAGCSTTSPRVVDEAAVVVQSEDNEAQYAIATREGHIGRIVVPVTINNKGTFYMMLDTGATHSVLTSKAVSRLGLDLTNAKSYEVQGVMGRINAPVVEIEELQAGALKLKDLKMPVIDGAVVAGLDGILGVDGMHDKSILADFVRDRIRIADGGSLPSSSWYAMIKFALVSKKLVVVDGMVGHIPVRAIIDTGGTQTLGNMALLKAIQQQKKDKYSIDGGVIDITDNTQNGRLVLVPSIKLGAADITNAAILFSEFAVFDVWDMNKKPTLLIGMDVLGQLGALSINYRRQELHVRAK